MHLSCTYIGLANNANNSFNGGTHAALEGTLHGGVNIALADAL